MAVTICLMYWGAPVLCAYIFIIVVFFLDWSLDHYVVSFLVSYNDLYFKVCLSDMSTATPAFFSFLFVWHIFFHPFIFSLYVSLCLKWVSCRQRIHGSCFCIHSASLCLLVGAFNPFPFKGFPGGSEVKASSCNAGDLGLIPGLGRCTGEGNGNPLQYSCLENPMDREAWWATVHGAAKRRTRLSDFTHSLTHDPVTIFLILGGLFLWAFFFSCVSCL